VAVEVQLHQTLKELTEEQLHYLVQVLVLYQQQEAEAEADGMEFLEALEAQAEEAEAVQQETLVQEYLDKEIMEVDQTGLVLEAAEEKHKLAQTLQITHKAALVEMD
jgi:hypothetical protein